MTTSESALSLNGFQRRISDIYSFPDDRLYSIEDLLIHQQRFAMRALKGIRKEDSLKTKRNLMIAFSWLMAIANRFHIEVEDAVWSRFPGLCLYCGKARCVCKKIKPRQRKKRKGDHALRPKSLADWQALFERIYPSSDRTLADAGVHFAEEVGEVSEAVHTYLGQHMGQQFEGIQMEIADEISCIFGVANSAGINVERELLRMYSHGCHVCHKEPCVCDFATVSKLKT